MKKDIKSAAVVESEAQTLETDIAASAAHDVQDGYRGDMIVNAVFIHDKDRRLFHILI